MKIIVLLILLLTAFCAKSQDIAALSVSTTASGDLKPGDRFTVTLVVDNFSTAPISPEVTPVFGGLPPLEITGISGPCQLAFLGQILPFSFLLLPIVFDLIATNASETCVIEYLVVAPIPPGGVIFQAEYFLLSIGVDPEPANNQGVVTLSFASMPIMGIPTLQTSMLVALFGGLLIIGVFQLRRR